MEIPSAYGVVKLIAPLSPSEWSATLLFVEQRIAPTAPFVAQTVTVVVPPDVVSGLAPNRCWVVDQSDASWTLACPIAPGYSICNVDLSGRVQMVLDLTNTTTRQPQLVPRAGTQNETYIAGSGQQQYFPFAASPSGIFTCAVASWAIGPNNFLPIILSSLQYQSPFGVPERDTLPLSKRVVDLVGLQFDLAPGTDGSTAIAMYKSVFPEYPLHESSPLALPIASVRQTEQILCCLKTTDPALTQQITRIRATIASGDEAILITSSRIGFLPNPNAATFYSNFAGTTGFIPFELAVDQLLRASRNLVGWNQLPLRQNTEEAPRMMDFADKVVGEYDSIWNWQYCLSEVDVEREEWIDIESTKVETYLTLDVPGFPWSLHPREHRYSTVYSAPLVGMVVLACRMAAGARNEAEVVQNIASALIQSGRFVYNYGATAFVVADLDPTTGLPNGRSQIELARMMEAVQGMLGKAIAADCVDLSHILMLLANSIGCNAKVGMLSGASSPNPGINTLESITLGAKSPVSGVNYTFHQIVYLGEQFTADAIVYDICFQLNTAPDTFIDALGLPLEKYLNLLVGDPSSVAETTFEPHEHIRFI